MNKSVPLVTIKGTKDGFILVLNDQCAYAHLLKELKEKLAGHSEHYQEGPMISVKVQSGLRYLTAEQEKEITKLIRSHKKLIVESFDSEVISRKECEELRKKTQLTTLTQIVRSGQVLELEGDLLLIGDVNPGATVRVTGNLYIMGAMKGMAQAGGNENNQAFIAASFLAPTQLQIGDVSSGIISDLFDEQQASQSMACAYVDSSSQQILIESIHSYFKKNKQLIKL